MTSLHGADGLPFSNELILAVAQHASRQADATAACIHSIGDLRGKPVQLPAAFLLELAAVIELGVWEKLSLRRHVECELPTYQEAKQYLVARSQKGPAEFEGPNASPLSIRVLQVWVDHFAWDAPGFLGAEAVVDEGDQEDDEFIDLLAEFVWTHRQELQHLISEERQP